MFFSSFSFLQWVQAAEATHLLNEPVGDEKFPGGVQVRTGVMEVGVPDKPVVHDGGIDHMLLTIRRTEQRRDRSE